MLATSLFNAHSGYLDGIVRGYRCSLISAAQYTNMAQCENLEDLKVQLMATDYSNTLQYESSDVLTVATLTEACKRKYIEDFKYLRNNSESPLSEFLDYITYAYMIDNVILLISGTLRGRDIRELLERCHPLGMFESLAALAVCSNVSELYDTVLVETPLAPYFTNALSAQDLNELNIEIIRNTLYKAYLEDFYAFVNKLDAGTAESMSAILQFEADRRVINITVNSFGTELTKEDRAKLFPRIGYLGNSKLSHVDDIDQTKAIVDSYPNYRKFFNDSTSHSTAVATNDEDGVFGSGASLESRFYEHEVHLNRLTFQDQFNFSCFYAWVKLIEQENRNILWIAECISQGQRDQINNYISIF